MYEIRDSDGILITTCLNLSVALERLETLPNAHYVQEVLEVRRFVAVRGCMDAQSIAEAAEAPF